MPKERDNLTGRYNREFKLSDFLNALEELGSASTSQVAEKVGCSRDLAYVRLKELLEEDKVEKEDISGNFRWELVENED